MDADLLKKLRYKEGNGLVLNEPESFIHDFSNEADSGDKFDFVMLFLNNAKELDEWLHKAIAAANPKAIFWVIYPKQSSKIKTDINRDILFKLIQSVSDYTIVSNVAVDETWSALRVRHVNEVKK